jgi:hypothetical protein
VGEDGVVRGWVRVLLWALILLACAGAGAFLASRSNPFPPEVPPEQATPTPTPVAEEPARWVLSLTSRTTHTLRVGGSCSSDWRMRTRIRVSPEGVVEGTGRARLQPGARCDFETAQVQARAVSIRIVGERNGDRLRLRFEVGDVEPSGAQDLGGFVETLPEMRFSLEERAGGSASGPTEVQVADDTHRAQTRLRLGGG